MASNRFVDAAHMAEWLGREDEDTLVSIAGVLRAAAVPGIRRIDLGNDCVLHCGEHNRAGRMALAAIACVIELYVEAGEELLPNFEALAEQIDGQQASAELQLLEGLWDL
jgi:hypothetical protein